MTGAAADAQEPDDTGYRLVLMTMRATDGVQEVLDVTVVESPVALSPDPPNADRTALGYVVEDAEGNVLVAGSVPDPELVRTPLPLPGEPETGHRVVARPGTEYVLRLPYDARMKTLYLTAGTNPPARAPNAPRNSPRPAQDVATGRPVTTINLEAWLAGL